MITITLRQILAAKPCYDPRDKELLPADHDLDAPIAFRDIAGAVNPEEVVWCFANLSGHDSIKRHFAVDCAERVRHLMTDERSLNALAVARRYADGEATDEELLAARDAASAAARDAGRHAASVAAWDVVRHAARDAAWAAAYAAASAAWAAARDAERAWQVQRIIELTDAGRWERSEEPQ